MGHPGPPQVKQLLQFLATQFGPMSDGSATALSREFGQHADQQDLGQWILQPSPLSPIIDPSENIVQGVQVKD